MLTPKLVRRFVASGFLAPSFGALLSAATYHVNPAGADQPSGGDAGAPWRTLYYAVSRAAAGDTIRLSGGTFPVPLSEVVTIDKPLIIAGAGRDDAPGAPRTVIAATYVESLAGTTNFGTPILRFTAAADGSRVEDIEFDGNSRRAGGAIHTATGTDNFVVTRCDFLRFYGSAVLLGTPGVFTGSVGLKVSHSRFENSGAETTGGSTGMLMIFGAIDSEFHHLDFYSAEAGFGTSGYGIKGRGLLRRVAIHRVSTDLKTSQQYLNRYDPNFAIEFWGNENNKEPSGRYAERAESVEIYDCTFRNTVSLAMPRQTVDTGNPYAVRLHHNTFDPKGWFGVEVSLYGILAEYNYFKQADSPFHNFVAATGETQDLRIQHNLAENVRGRFICVEGKVTNMDVRNNTVFLTAKSQATDRRDFVVFGSSNAAGSNVTLHNNVVVGALPNLSGDLSAYRPNFYRAPNYTPAGLLAYGAVGLNVSFPAPTASGPFYSLNGAFDKISGDPQLELSGAKPSPYYNPKAVSVSRDSGYDWNSSTTPLPRLGAAPERGAMEAGEDYIESFPNTTAANLPVGQAGWKVFTSGSDSVLGALVTDNSSTGLGAAISNAAGVSPTRAINSFPSSTTSNGFVWGGGASSKEAFFHSSEFYAPNDGLLTFGELSRLSWNAGNGSTAIAQRPAVKIGGLWYVAESSYSTPAMGFADFPSASVRHTLDVAATAWRRLDFTAGTTGFQFAGTTTAASALAGEVEAVGLYVVHAGAAGGNSRFDAFAVEAVFKPGIR